jgi:hypothetical protein
MVEEGLDEHVALFLLDVLLGLFNRLGRNDGFVNDSVFDFRHDVSPVHEG